MPVMKASIRYEPPGVVGLRGDEVGGPFGRQAFPSTIRAGRGALDGGLRSMTLLQYGVL